MAAFMKLHATSIIAFPALDAVWPGLVARNISRVQVGELLRAHPRREATISAAVATVGYFAAGWLGAS